MWGRSPRCGSVRSRDTGRSPRCGLATSIDVGQVASMRFGEVPGYREVASMRIGDLPACRCVMSPPPPVTGCFSASPCSLAGIAQASVRDATRRSDAENELWGRPNSGKKRNHGCREAQRENPTTVTPNGIFPAVRVGAPLLFFFCSLPRCAGGAEGSTPYPATSTIFVTSGGAPTRDGGPAVPKPRFTHNVEPARS